MDQLDIETVAKLIREKRAVKGYTQQELSDLTGISLRSVQRIENGEVIPRSYTLRTLFEKLEIPDLPVIAQKPGSSPTPEPAAQTQISNTASPIGKPTPRHPNHSRKRILSISIGLLLFLGTAAFIAQSHRFPETDFERFLLWIGVIIAYTLALLRIWR